MSAIQDTLEDHLGAVFFFHSKIKPQSHSRH